MARTYSDLTSNEKNVLGHVVVDPEAWWDHAVATGKVDEEAVLSEKVSRWQQSYDTASAEVGYAPRAERTDETPAVWEAQKEDV